MEIKRMRMLPSITSFQNSIAFFLTCVFCLGMGWVAQADPDVAQSSNLITIKLSRPVPFVAQSTNGTCWLACAAMVRQYYGQKIDESGVDKNVREITLSNRRGQLKANRRECLIALAQNGGFQESLLHQGVDSKDDVTNQAGAVKDTLTNLPNQMSTNQNGKISVTTTNKPKSWLFSGGKLNFNPVKLAKGEIQEHTLNADTGLLVESLTKQEPVVIVCRLGRWSKEEHAMVVTGVTYTNNPNAQGSQMKIVSVDVLDPAADSATSSEKPGEYLQANLKIVLTKSVAEKILENERDSITHSP
jgi:hypothetical protein